MKALKTILVTIALVGSIVAASAQKTVVRIYPKHGTVVATISKPRVVVHKKTKFYVSDGIWYKARGRKYVVCAAPVGFKIRTLPRAHRVVYVKGRKFYKYRGIWYKKRGRNFVVVTV